MEIKTIYIADIQKIFVDCLIANFEKSQQFEILGASSSGAAAYGEVKN